MRIYFCVYMCLCAGFSYVCISLCVCEYIFVCICVCLLGSMPLSVCLSVWNRGDTQVYKEMIKAQKCSRMGNDFHIYLFVCCYECVYDVCMYVHVGTWAIECM